MMPLQMTEGNPSLNECLHVGPKFNQKLLDILIRFRAHRVAVTADIEKAFLMVQVEKNDRDASLGTQCGRRSTEDSTPESGFFKPLHFEHNHQTPLILEGYRESHPHLVQLLLDSFYVDDLTAGGDSEEEVHSVSLACSETSGQSINLSSIDRVVESL